MAKKKDKVSAAAVELTVEQKKVQLIEKAKKDGHIDQREILIQIPETVENTEILDAVIY